MNLARWIREVGVRTFFAMGVGISWIGLAGQQGLAGDPVACKTDADCNDKNACTEDLCNANKFCEHESIKCDDGNACTNDKCEAEKGCTYVNNDAKCDDGNKCTTDDVCAEGACVGGAPLDCKDDKFCTDDACDPKLGCVHENHTGPCDDGNACTVEDSCVEGSCVGGSEVKCDDENECTDDKCEPEKGCTYVNTTAKCEDGNKCTTDDVCADGVCVGGAPLDCKDDKFCTDDACDPKLGCVHENHEGSCDDGNPCTTKDHCAEGSCVGGEETDCDDGLFCNGEEKCEFELGCVGGKNPCPKEDTCDEENDRCLKCVSDDACDDGLFCNGSETCDPEHGCQKGEKACGEQACDEETDKCTGCISDDKCDDGLFCNGQEKCEGEFGCFAGDSPCPKEDICDEENDRCLKCVSDDACDDGLFCNGLETCDPKHGCQKGGKPCGEQPCDEDTDKCTGCGKDDQCDDGLFCNGQEKCEGDGSCHPGPEPCGVLACNEEKDICGACASDADCDDGMFCNGTELCIEGKCDHGTTPCPEELCDEDGDACVPCGSPSSAFCLKVGAVDQLSIWLGLEGKGSPDFDCAGDDPDLLLARGLLLQSLGVDDPASGLSGSQVIWGDSNHVDPAHGGFHGADVFTYEAEACDHLDSYLQEGPKKGCPAEGIEALKLAMSGADRTLAETAINDASAAGGDSTQIALALDLLAQADAAAKAGDVCETALGTYEESWSTAVYSYATSSKAATQSLIYTSPARGAGAAGPWITISTADPLGYDSGTADFLRAYPVGSTLTLTAPAVHETHAFVGWQLGGVLQTDEVSLALTVALGQSDLVAAYGTCEERLYGDVHPAGGNHVIDVDDLVYVLDGFSDANTCVNYPRADLSPCGATCDVVDVDDILAELAAFSGVFECPHSCE